MLPSLPCHECITGNTKDDKFIYPESGKTQGLSFALISSDTNFLNDLVIKEDSKITMVLELYHSLNLLLARNELSFKSKSQLKFVTEILGNGLMPPFNKFHKKNEKKVHKGIIKIYEYILFGSVEITQGTDKKILVKREDPKVTTLYCSEIIEILPGSLLAHYQHGKRRRSADIQRVAVSYDIYFRQKKFWTEFRGAL